jgi:methylmalonyl-CoA mutase N-terminal domain/subunit
LRLDPAIEDLQRKKLEELRKKRDGGEVRNHLEKLKKAAQGSDNLMPIIIDAVRAYATLGEIAIALREFFGDYTEAVIL